MTALATRKASLLPPKKQEKILSIIDTKLASEDEAEQVSWTLTSLARRCGVHPPSFIAALHEGMKDTKHKYRYFALKVFERWGQREDILHKRAFNSSKSRDDWKGFVTLLERTQEEWRPIRDNGTGGNTSIGIVEKMVLLQQQGQLPQGD